MMKTKILKKTAKVHEVFVSQQGEGPYVGEKQIFFRFSRCNMVCHYCDTDNSVGEEQSIDSILSLLEETYWKHQGIQSISFTGGEPLLYPEAIQEIAQWGQRQNLKLFLETNATLPHAFIQVAGDIDVVSMDIKLPSVSQTPDYQKEHEAFLKEILRAEKECYIKIVVSKGIDLKEFEQAVEIIARNKSDLPLFLQPVSPLGGVEAIGLEELETLKQIAQNRLLDVRVQPQWHKYWRIR